MHMHDIVHLCFAHPLSMYNIMHVHLLMSLCIIQRDISRCTCMILYIDSGWAKHTTAFCLLKNLDSLVHTASLVCDNQLVGATVSGLH